MRLLGINNTYPPIVSGGYAEICADVMDGLAGRGHDVTILACGEAYAPVPPDDPPYVERRLGYVLAPWRRPWSGLRSAWRDAKVTTKALDGVDAVLAWHCRGISKNTLRACHERGVPVLYFLHDRWLLYERPGSLSVPWTWLDHHGARVPREALGRLLAPWREMRAPRPDLEGTLCYVSRWVRDEHHRRGYVGRREAIVPCGVRLGEFARASPTSEPPTRLLFAGRIEPRKGLHVAIEALANAPEAMRLSVAGPVDDPAYDRAMRELAQRHGVSDRVDWLGEVSRGSVRALLLDHDVLVFPSLGVEAYALGLLEAFAAGVSVVTSAPGGPREYVVHDGNALVHEPGDVAAMAAALRRLADEPALVGRLREGAAVTAAEHSLERVLDHVEQLLHE